MEARTEVVELSSRPSRWTWQAWLAMLLLIAQSTALSVVLRLSRVRSGTPYLASVSGEVLEEVVGQCAELEGLMRLM